MTLNNNYNKIQHGLENLSIFGEKMKRLNTDNHINVFILQDIEEWGREFYGMPQGAELENKVELECEPMGFSELESNTIWLFIPRNHVQFNDVFLTVAHELGHIITGGFKKNPPNKPRYAKRHEQKAEHYENFAKCLIEICDLIYDDLNKE